jgi:WD40 repeat protein
VIAVVSALVGAGIAVPFLLQGSPKQGATQPGETAHSPSASAAGGPSASASATPSGSAPGNAHSGPVALQFPAEVTAGAGKISGIAFSPDGKALAVADTGKVCVWDIAASRCGPELASAWAVAFSPDGKTLATSDLSTASGTPNGDIRQWDVSSGRPDPVNPAMTNPGSLGAQSIAYSPDGQTLAVGDQNGSTYLWDAGPGPAVAALRDPGGDPAAMGVNAVAFSGDGRLLAAADGDGSVYLWDTGTRKLVTHLTGPGSDGVRAVAVSADGQTVAAGDGNGHTYLWQGKATTWTLARQFAAPGPAGSANAGVRAVTFSPDGQRLAIGDIDGTTDVREVSTGRRLASLPDRDGGGVTSAAFRPDGRVLAVGDERGGVLLWPVGA